MSLKLMSPTQITYVYDDHMTKLKQNWTGRLPVFVQPSLYRALKVAFPQDIGGLSLDDTIKSEIGTAKGSNGQSVGILTPAMFNAYSQP